MDKYAARTYNITDFDAVVALWKAAGIILSRSDLPEGLQQKLERDADLFFVLEDESGKLIGAVMGSFDGRQGWINHLAIDPNYQGKELGKIMMAELEKRYKAIGYEKVNLLIEPTNSAVQAFYKGMGYTADKPSPDQQQALYAFAARNSTEIDWLSYPKARVNYPSSLVTRRKKMYLKRFFQTPLV